MRPHAFPAEFVLFEKLITVYGYPLKILRELKSQTDELIKTGLREKELKEWRSEIIKAAQGTYFI